MQKRKCVECGKEFTITDAEEKFYAEKHLSLPTHCKECREKRKQEHKNGETQKTNEYHKDPNHGNSRRYNDAPERPTQTYVKKNGIYTLLVLLVIVAILAVTKLPTILHGNENEPVIQTEEDSQSTVQDTEDNQETAESASDSAIPTSGEYKFRSNKLLTEHFEKHGGDFDYPDKEAYEAGACAVINSPDVLTKTEAEDGDYVYYIEKTNEFVILSKDGYIRTYFKPDAGIDYYNRQ